MTSRAVAMLLSGLVFLSPLAAPGPARGGHEMPFYPSYYPQEITVETVAPAAARPRLAAHTLHAYVGADPWAGAPLPPGVRAFESLGGWVVVTLNPRSRGLAARGDRCAAARRIVGALPARRGVWLRHPYPVTPWHPDYLQHADLAEAAVRALPAPGSVDLPPGFRVRARGALAQALVGRRGGAHGEGWDAVVETVDVRDLVLAASGTLHGGLAPPWLKEGWFQAHALLAGAMADPRARREAEETFQRLVAGAERPVERLGLERTLVARLSAGCERVVAGYTLRREVVDDDYSQGVENVALDSQTGLNSAIFLRTVKLKDFPWNGWLTVGVPQRPAAAWNPVAGFTDATGRLIWAAIADPALLPEPAGAGWVDNRVRVRAEQERSAEGPIPVPRDALLPEPGTGLLSEVGEGKTARARLTYEVLTSLFHDGTRMTAADALYALAFAFRWGGGRGADADPAVERATALMRAWLAGVKVRRVRTDVLRFGDVVMRYEVPVVDVYLSRPVAEPHRIALVAAPWSTTPWHVLALAEEAVRRGWAAFSVEEARRRGVPWLDLVRDAGLRDRLRALTGELEARAHVPAPLAGLVTAPEARRRWGLLARWAEDHGHFLVTSGPYQVHQASPTGAVLRVFRDFSYPLGVGSFDRYPTPLRGYIARVERRGDRLEVVAEVERVERFAREYRIVAEPLGPPAAQAERGAVAACRYLVVGADGAVLRAGSVPPSEAGLFVIGLDGLPRAVPHTVLLAVAVNGNLVNAQTRIVRVD